MYKIKWKGCNTQRNIWWNRKANSYSELWEDLCNRRITHSEQYEEYQLKKHDMDMDNFFDEDGEFMYEPYNDLMADGLEECEYRDLIEKSNGNAYYQWFWEWNDELGEYEEV